MHIMNTPMMPPEAAEPVSPETDLLGSSEAGPAALRGSALLGGGYVATIGLALISVPLLIRHLGIAAFGRYTTVIALVTIVSGLTDAGLVNIALREWASRAGDDRARLMRSLLGIRIELSAGGILIALIFAVLAGYDRTLVLGTVVAAAGMMLQALTNILTVSLQGQLRFGWATIIMVVRQVVSVALIVALVLAGAGLLPLLAVGLAASLVTLVLAAALVRGEMPLTPQLGDAQWWPLVRDTLPYGAAIAVNTLYFRITIIAMSLIAAAQQTGYFATSFRVIEVLIGVPALAIGAAFPILSRSAREDRDRFAYATKRIVELAVIAGIGLSLVVALSAPLVVRVLGGAAAAPAASVLQIQAVALAATFLTVACAFVLLSLRRHTVLLVANGVALLANVALTILLVPVDQARGAAIAAVGAEICLALGLLAVLVRTRVASLRLRSLAAVAIAGTAGAAPLLASGLAPILRTLTGMAIYAGMLAILGLLPPELAHAIKHRPRS